LRPTGLHSSQFTILQVLSRMGELSQGQLAEVLAMDSTTLTRTLAIMRRNGWITERRGDDRRQRWLQLSRAGETQLKRATPLWEQAQAQLRAQLGDAAWEQLFHLANRVTNIVTSQGV
jgi:DNA-binding MarR family transcriptional regulator